MKRIHMLESRFKLLSESYWDNGNYEAGTDFPKFYDKKTDTYWDAAWDDGDGMPFAYWPMAGGGYEFYVGEPYSTHKDICRVAAERYIEDAIKDDCLSWAEDFITELQNLLEVFETESYRYDEENDIYVSDDGGQIDLNDWAEENCGMLPSDWAYEFAEDAIGRGEMPDAYELSDWLYDRMMSDFDVERDGISDYTRYQTFDDFFRDGYGMGRIWPEKEMIGFYTTEQPDPDTFYQILGKLSEKSDVGVDFFELKEFFIIFEDYDNDGVVTGCTVNDYINGNYGPETDNGEEPDLDRERTFGDGNTQMNVHLASPEEKKRLAIFKNFQNNRDTKWAPRLKGFGGNMAAYRAARYPYSDSKIIRGNVINEGDKRKKSRH